eukprot:236679_1
MNVNKHNIVLVVQKRRTPQSNVDKLIVYNKEQDAYIQAVTYRANAISDGDLIVVPHQVNKPVPVNVVVFAGITGLTTFDNSAIIRREAWTNEKAALLRSFLSQSATFEVPVAFPTVSICQVFILHDIRYSVSTGGGFLLQADIQGADGVA